MPDDVKRTKLNTAIQAWRDSLDGLDEAQRDELEDHLRKEISSLDHSSHLPDKKVRIAAERLGRPQDWGGYSRRRNIFLSTLRVTTVMLYLVFPLFVLLAALTQGHRMDFGGLLLMSPILVGGVFACVAALGSKFRGAWWVEYPAVALNLLWLGLMLYVSLDLDPRHTFSARDVAIAIIVFGAPISAIATIMLQSYRPASVLDAKAPAAA